MLLLLELLLVIRKVLELLLFEELLLTLLGLDELLLLALLGLDELLLDELLLLVLATVLELVELSDRLLLVLLLRLELEALLLELIGSSTRPWNQKSWIGPASSEKAIGAIGSKVCEIVLKTVCPIQPSSELLLLS